MEKHKNPYERCLHFRGTFGDSHGLSYMPVSLLNTSFRNKMSTELPGLSGHLADFRNRVFDWYLDFKNWPIQK